MRKIYLLSIVLLISLIACKDPVIPAAHNPIVKATKLEQQLNTNKSRDVWQRPSDVLDFLGDISGKTIADIGAGTGFFSFRLLFRNAKVIAIDIDPAMIEIVEGFKLNLSQDMQSKIQSRLALPNDPKLKQNEADIILIINTVGFIESRDAYLKNLYDKLPEGGKIMIVDFKENDMPVSFAPSIEYRVSVEKMKGELEKAGFTIQEANKEILDYQYVIVANK